MKEIILILDFGSQYTHLIKARLADIGVSSLILPGDAKVNILKKDFLNQKVIGIILSGGAVSVYQKATPFDKRWLRMGVPILGICYGHQLIASLSGGKIRQSKPEFGKAKIKIVRKNPLLHGKFSNSIVWMSHRESVTQLPRGLEIIALSEFSPITAFFNKKRQLYGVQFHPEVSHTKFGVNMLKNFCFDICKATPGKKWSPKIFIKEISSYIKKTVGNSKVIFGLSGGVDSLTMSVLLRKILGKDQILAVYVDDGLMPSETVNEVKGFCKKRNISLLVVDESNLFFNRLKNVTDPSQKCKIIGKAFIDVFERIASKNQAKVFAQGTIWSDVIESGVTKFSSQIKPHHNVGGLPKKLKFTLLEPFRELFKDQVREIAKYLGLPEWVIRRKVFPGPGFAIRVQGETTPEKVEIVRKATKIIEDVLKEVDIFDKPWMAFAILIYVPSLGIKGDKRQEYQQAIVVRIVESKNSMTANFSRKVFPCLEKISRRITNETNIGRVVYDITDKPPATIEWQ